MRAQIEDMRERGLHAQAEALKARHLRRMHDLSVFMQELKQSFSRWFNGRHGRQGCLWEERFRSVLVEAGQAARVVSAYIDLNPVRAGIVEKAEEYRWSGWGEAVAGGVEARSGVSRVMLERELGRSNPELALRDTERWEDVAAEYSQLMEHDRERCPARRADRADAGACARPHEDPDVGPKSRRRRPRRLESALVHERTRVLTEGMVFGCETFVEALFQATRDRFPPGRRSGARRIAGIETGLRTMRALRPGPT